MTRKTDPLARLERIFEREARLTERLAGERAHEEGFWTNAPRPAEDALAGKILATLEPRIRADVPRLELQFTELVASDSWGRLVGFTRTRTRVSRVSLPRMVVSLRHGRALLDGEQLPCGLPRSGDFRWSLHPRQIELQWEDLPRGGRGCAATFATFPRFRDLATLALSPRVRETGERVRFMTLTGKPVWLGRAEARATLALATARLLELVERGEILRRAVDVWAHGSA